MSNELIFGLQNPFRTTSKTSELTETGEAVQEYAM